MIDLQAFCGTDPRLPYLHAPFGRGDKTYATDGQICVRVPRLPDYPDGEKVAAEKAFPVEPPPTVRSLSRFQLPKPKSEPCIRCDGRGTEHDCPECTCECEECGGNGTVIEAVTVSLDDAVFDAEYIALLMKLPNVQVPASPPKAAVMYFTFEGGDGVLMPMTGKLKTHVADPERAPA